MAMPSEEEAPEGSRRGSIDLSKKSKFKKTVTING